MGEVGPLDTPLYREGHWPAQSSVEPHSEEPERISHHGSLIR